MKASELRIGNWVLNKRYKSGYEMQIESIGEFGLNIELSYDGLNPIIDDDCGFNECEPIPLTEEWLLKFGFVGNYKTYYSNINLICELHFDELNNEFDCVIDRYSITTINYVHQLQNLYFALTGEEL